MTRLASTVACVLALGACSSGDSGGGTVPPATPTPAGAGTQMQNVTTPPATGTATGVIPAAPSQTVMTPMAAEPMVAEPMAAEPMAAEPMVPELMPSGMDPMGMAGAGAEEPGAEEPGAGDPPPPAGDTAGNVTIAFTTVTVDGEYAPGNYGAVWFEQPDGTFIKTVKRWAGSRHQTDLVAWAAASGAWPSTGLFGGGGGNAEDMMDAVSQATIRAHESHSVPWDFMVAGELLPDGPYVVALEVSEDRESRPGPVVKIEFMKGPEAQTAEAPDQEGFNGIAVTYTP